MAFTTLFRGYSLIITAPLFPLADTIHREPQCEGEMLIPHTKNRHSIMPPSPTELSKTETAGSGEESRPNRMKRS